MTEHLANFLLMVWALKWPIVAVYAAIFAYMVYEVCHAPLIEDDWDLWEMEIEA